MKKARVDATVENHGSIFLFALHSKAARAWWDRHVMESQEFAGRKVVEHRYAAPIADGMQADGLVVA